MMGLKTPKTNKKAKKVKYSSYLLMQRHTDIIITFIFIVLYIFASKSLHFPIVCFFLKFDGLKRLSICGFLKYLSKL